MIDLLYDIFKTKIIEFLYKDYHCIVNIIINETEFETFISIRIIVKI